MAPTTPSQPSSQTSTQQAATSARRGNETTLTHLTKRFVRLLNSSSQRVINLNDASKRLEVPKRRIYDITNVLEGIGLLQKTAKNVTRWIDCPSDSAFAARPSKDLIDPELDDLRQTYQLLDNGIKEMEANIRKIFGADGAYVTYQDVKAFFNDQTVIAVKAPPETKLEVNESLQIWMKCERSEAIEVYLYNTANTNNTTTTTTTPTNNPTQQPQQQPSSQTHHHHPQQTPQLPQQQQPQQINGYQINTSPHLQQSQLSNSSNTQPLDSTITSNNLIGQQQTQPIYNMPVSSDEGRGTDDGQYYESTSGVSNDDQFMMDDLTFSSALSGTNSEYEDPFKPLMPIGMRDETYYNFAMDNCTLASSLYPEDNLGILDN